MPFNENARIEALRSYDIIGEIENEDYDFITSMAAEICQTPIALITLVTEDKQWFLSHHGIAIRETPREYSFCSVAIEETSDIFLLPDSLKDIRFKNNPFVHGDPPIIFYAGVPLINYQGFPLGTLCAIDSKPRTLNDAQIKSLKGLAQQVVRLLELRKKIKENNRINSQLKKTTMLINESLKLNLAGSWEVDLDTLEGKWTDEIPAIHELSGEEALITQNYIELYSAKDQQKIAHVLERAQLYNESFNITCSLTTKNGNTKHVKIVGKTWLEEGEDKKLIGALQDITEQTNTLDSLKKERARIANILEGTNVGHWEWNVQTGETVYNERWAEIIGYDLGELNAKSIETWKALAHPDDLVLSYEALQKCFNGESDFYAVEIRMKHKSGKWVWVLDRGKIFSYTEDGKPLMMFGTHTDITKRKEAEIQLKISEEAFRGNFEHAAIGMAILAPEGNWIRVNDALCVMLGFSNSELLSMPTLEIMNREDFLLAKQIIDRKRASYQLEKSFRHKNGSIVHAIVSVSSVRNERSEIIYFIAQLVDITKLKSAEQEVRYLLEITQDQNERLKNFAHIVSHNLRSHSGGISGLLSLLKMENPTVYQNEMVQYIKKASDNLTETIQHLTDVIKISLNANDKFEGVELFPVIEKVITTLHPQIITSGIEVTNKIPQGLCVKAIPAYLDSIVINFISNAIKYKSPDRTPKLAIECQTEGHKVHIKFIDNGLGIDLNKYGDKLFGMYRTFHEHEDSRGIGLFITKNQIEAMGGRVSVESKVNHGTSFVVTLNLDET